MKLLLLGANGQLGREIIDISNNFPVTVYPFSKSECDITQCSQINHVIRKLSPDYVINAAAYTAVDKAESERDLAYQINTIGPKNLAEVCSEFDIPLIHISTDYVFDGSKRKPYIETDTTNPINFYGKSKLDGELNIVKHCHKYIIIRTSWVFSKYGSNFVKTMCRLMRERQSLKIVADQYGCPTYAGYLAHAIMEILNKPKWGIYHYSNSPETNWFEFATTIYDILKQHIELAPVTISPILSKDYPLPAIRPHNSVLSSKHFIDTFGIETRAWKDSLDDVIANEVKIIFG